MKDWESSELVIYGAWLVRYIVKSANPKKAQTPRFVRDIKVTPTAYGLRLTAPPQFP